MADTAKIARQPLALGLQQWGPLPGTVDLFLLWDGPGGGIYLTNAAGSYMRPVQHPAASGTYQTVREAKRAVTAFAAEVTEGGGHDG
jgi:hypothetical protein